MPSLGAQIAGYMVLAGAAAAMATGAVGIFGSRLRSVVIYSAILQAGYAALALAAALLTGDAAGYSAAVFQAIAGGCGIGLMWIAAQALIPHTGDSLPLPGDSSPPAWAVFCLVVACMSLVGLPPMAGLAAKIAVIHASLREPGVLFLAALGAAALGAAALWSYAGIALPLITSRAARAPARVTMRVRVLVDALVAAVIALGLAPYIGFAIGAAVTGGR
jgi:formate hydrogenlyase subunit 3/multisubunit Na+/H+ antiporter MnhD subunit